MTKQPIRWGLLGTGAISTQFVKHLICSEGSRVVAVAGRSDTKARLFAKQAGASQSIETYGSIEELCQCSEVDVVYVGTPTHVHKQHCESVLLQKSISSAKNHFVNHPLNLMKLSHWQTKIHSFAWRPCGPDLTHLSRS